MESVLFGSLFSVIAILVKLAFMVLVVYYLAKIANKNKTRLTLRYESLSVAARYGEVFYVN